MNLAQLATLTLQTHADLLVFLDEAWGSARLELALRARSTTNDFPPQALQFAVSNLDALKIDYSTYPFTEIEEMLSEIDLREALENHLLNYPVFRTLVEGEGFPSHEVSNKEVPAVIDALVSAESKWLISLAKAADKDDEVEALCESRSSIWASIKKNAVRRKGQTHLTPV